MLRFARRATPSHFMLLLVVGMWADLAGAAEFTVERGEKGVTVRLDGELFTEYLIDKGPKPILWPIIGPTGKPITRAYPMERINGERMDHPHHRSFWFTHGDVNGVDFWAELGKNPGKIVHREFREVSGGERASIVTVNDWTDREGKKVCEDERRLTFHAVGDMRAIDFDITIRAGDSPVTFGDTKEGSFGIRIPTTMDVDSRPGGAIINSNGETDGDAWAKRAAWVDYHGPVDGEHLGIAVLNHPSSFRYPTHWHVRTYGLFAANPFGIHDFEPNSGASGAHTVEPGESFSLRYRVLLHKGDEKEAKIAEAFEAYSQEPKE